MRYFESLRSRAFTPAAGECPLGDEVSISGLTFKASRSASNIWTLEFTLAAVRLTVTDAGASGASASLKLFDFAPGIWQTLSSWQHYTAFAEGSALTTAAGDASFILACGSVAADAGDRALTSTEVDIADATGTLTDSSGTTTGDKLAGALSPINGLTTAVDLYLNWSGSAATIDASSTFDVTGKIIITGIFTPK
jgi:hypothetical protein